MNTQPFLYAARLIHIGSISVLVLLLACSYRVAFISTEPTPTPTSIPTPTPTPKPTVTANILHAECEEITPPHSQMLSLMFDNTPPCYLEGERLRIQGIVGDVNYNDTEGSVELIVERWLNPEAVLQFEGIILQGLSRVERAILQEGGTVSAECTVGESVFIGISGTGRVLTDCVLGN